MMIKVLFSVLGCVPIWIMWLKIDKIASKTRQIVQTIWDIGKQFNVVLQDFGIFSP